MSRVARSVRISLALLSVAVAGVVAAGAEAAPSPAPRVQPVKPRLPGATAPLRLTDAQRLAAMNVARSERGLAPLQAAPAARVDLSIGRPFDPADVENRLEISQIKSLQGVGSDGESSVTIRPLGHYDTWNGVVYLHARLAAKTLHFVDCRVGPTDKSISFRFAQIDPDIKVPATGTVAQVDGHVHFAFMTGAKEIAHLSLDAASQEPTWALWTFFGCEIMAAS